MGTRERQLGSYKMYGEKDAMGAGVLVGTGFN